MTRYDDRLTIGPDQDPYQDEDRTSQGPHLEQFRNDYQDSDEHYEDDHDEHIYDDHDEYDEHIYDEYDEHIYDEYDEHIYDEHDEYDEDGGPGGQGSFVDRRHFLQLMVAGGATAAGYLVVNAGRERPGPPPQIEQPSTQVGVVTRPVAGPDTAGLLVAGAVPDRVLVLVELVGGNDALSTMIPYSQGSYYDFRPTIGIAPEEVLPVDAEVGLNPNLARLHQRGLALVEGVGPVDGTLSHFEMVQRWDAGDVSGEGELTSGFLARLADTVDDGSPLVGLSVSGSTPRFANSTASTLGLENLNALRFLTATDDLVLASYHQSLRSLPTNESSMGGVVGTSWLQLLDLGATLSAQLDRENDETNPMFTDGGRLGRQLALAADLISANIGVRVVHAALGGFDTHVNHRNRHNQLMAQLDAAVGGFLQRMDQDGQAQRVLVATTSEFGRRVAENEGQGTDHGAGSVMMVAGPVRPGRYGVTTPVDRLDRNGNLPVDVPFDAYLGTLAERWLGIEAASVLPNQPELLPFL